MVGHERAQGIHEDARAAPQERLAHGVHLKHKRFTAPRAHDGKAALAVRKTSKRLFLRRMKRPLANKRMHNRTSRLVI